MKPIERLTLKNLEAIYALNLVCFPQDFTTKEMYTELLEDPRTHVYAICDDTTPVSFIAIYNWKGENDYIKIMSIGTHPNHRGQGYAHRLMGHIKEVMLEDDMRKFRAETRQSNLQMQKVFENMGYRIINRVDDYYNNPCEPAYKYGLDI